MLAPGIGARLEMAATNRPPKVLLPFGGKILLQLHIDWALSLGAMAYVSALRETSVVFAVLIGWILLGEPFGRRRVAAAILVGLGIAIMQIAG